MMRGEVSHAENFVTKQTNWQEVTEVRKEMRLMMKEAETRQTENERAERGVVRKERRETGLEERERTRKLRIVEVGLKHSRESEKRKGKCQIIEGHSLVHVTQGTASTHTKPPIAGTKNTTLNPN
jgi:hypothetical protein